MWIGKHEAVHLFCNGGCCIINYKYDPLEKIPDLWKDPQPGELVVQVFACGVCARDEIVKGQHKPYVSYPRVPGHEIVGTVATISSTEKRYVGKRVGSGWPGGHCHSYGAVAQRTLSLALRAISTVNRTVHVFWCVTVDWHGSGIKKEGGYTDYVTLRLRACLRIQTQQRRRHSCAGVTTFNSLRDMNINPPEVVAVQGIGGLGHLALQFARALGYQTVALSTSSAKEGGCREHGVREDRTAALKRLGGANVVVRTAPNSAAIEALLLALTDDGLILLLADTRDVSLPCVRGWQCGSAAEQAQEAFVARASEQFRAIIVP
ncbi:hypothetical protein B0H21DRAFT_777820 [Amylocystis lapponica]|nr:hypothetical protein B0H21DRAFT_777820 [Amylocystis lapponica]